MVRSQGSGRTPRLFSSVRKTGSDQAVAAGRRGLGLEAATDREDGPLQFARNAYGEVVVGSRQVVEAHGGRLQIVMTQLAEPDLGAADDGADGHNESPAKRGVIAR
jgi:hypothetical protein